MACDCVCVWSGLKTDNLTEMIENLRRMSTGNLFPRNLFEMKTVEFDISLVFIKFLINFALIKEISAVGFHYGVVRNLQLHEAGKPFFCTRLYTQLCLSVCWTIGLFVSLYFLSVFAIIGLTALAQML